MSRENNIKPVKDLIFKGASLHSMAKVAQVFSQTDNAVKSALPSMLSDNCQTKAYDQGILTLTTYSNAIATQIRYNTPNIIARLKKHAALADIKRIDIKVVAKPKETSQSTQSRPPVSASNCSILKDTANNMTSNKLADSLRQLASTLENYGKD